MIETPPAPDAAVAITDYSLIIGGIRNPQAAIALRNALAELGRTDPADLIGLAAALHGRGGHDWLKGLTAAAAGWNTAIKAARAARLAGAAADQAHRGRFDALAIRLFGEGKSEVENLTTSISFAADSRAGYIKRQVADGLPSDLAIALADQRHSDSASLAQRLEAARRRVAALDAFLEDPLRSTDRLLPEQLATMEAILAVPTTPPAPPPPVPSAWDRMRDRLLGIGKFAA